MSKGTDTCDLTETLEFLQAQNERLRLVNRTLKDQIESVAAANAHAAELMVELAEANKTTKATALIVSLKKKNKHLVRENKKLQQQADGVATANANAAELMVQLTDLNKTLQQEIHLRKNIEKELRQANKQMDARVKERTTELTALNEQMKKEIDERKHAQEELGESEGRTTAGD